MAQGIKGLDIGRINDVVGHVTFKAFRSLMARRHLGLDDLVPQFRGQLEDGCRDILTRIMKGPATMENVVIPYRCLLKFYFGELKSQEKVREHRKRGGSPIENIDESRN